MKCLIKKDKGFTLIELMIVVAVIGILAAVSAPKFGEMLKTNKIETAKAHMKSYEQALKNYYSDVHALPALSVPDNGVGMDVNLGLSRIDEWEIYFTTSTVQFTGGDYPDPDANSDGQIDNWHGAYMTKLNNDPWGNSYVFQDNRNDSDPDTITAIISGGPQNTITFDKTAAPLLGVMANERGLSVAETAGNDYMIVLWLD